MKIVSVMTTDSSGGAEFAAVEMLEALRQRGHDTVDAHRHARDGARHRRAREPRGARAEALHRQLGGPDAALAAAAARLRDALRAQAPYDVLMVHYKKEQLLAAMLPAQLRRTIVWAEWGPVPFPLRRGLPRRVYLRAGERAARTGCLYPHPLGV